MYEKITGYLKFFGKNASPEAQEKTAAFVADFSQSGLMNPDGMEIMGQRGWATRTALKNDAPTMTAEEVCACLSAFVMQESFCEGILWDLVQQGVLPVLLERLKELDG